MAVHTCVANLWNLMPMNEAAPCSRAAISGDRLFNPRSTKRRKQMSIIWMLLVGLIVGAIAKLMMPGKDPGGIFITMLLGVAGALVAGFLGRGLGWYREGDPVGWFASIIGAVILLGLYRLVAARRAL